MSPSGPPTSNAPAPLTVSCSGSAAFHHFAQRDLLQRFEVVPAFIPRIERTLKDLLAPGIYRLQQQCAIVLIHRQVEYLPAKQRDAGMLFRE